MICSDNIPFALSESHPDRVIPNSYGDPFQVGQWPGVQSFVSRPCDVGSENTRGAWCRALPSPPYHGRIGVSDYWRRKDFVANHRPSRSPDYVEVVLHRCESATGCHHQDLLSPSPRPEENSTAHNPWILAIWPPGICPFTATGTSQVGASSRPAGLVDGAVTDLEVEILDWAFAVESPFQLAAALPRLFAVVSDDDGQETAGEDRKWFLTGTSCTFSAAALQLSQRILRIERDHIKYERREEAFDPAFCCLTESSESCSPSCRHVGHSVGRSVTRDRWFLFRRCSLHSPRSSDTEQYIDTVSTHFDQCLPGLENPTS
nr:hypothetical protein CFP56_30110 [Quercus suber]